VLSFSVQHAQGAADRGEGKRLELHRAGDSADLARGPSLSASAIAEFTQDGASSAIPQREAARRRESLTMDWTSAAMLAAGGFVAGVINTLAGGGSMLTVPLLVLLGLPGTVANGTNRIGILAQTVSATWSFEGAGVHALRPALPVLFPLGLGALVGALGAAQLSDQAFEKGFGIVMILLLLPTLRPPKAKEQVAATPSRGAVHFLIFFSIGVYGGAFQAGVGLFLLLALARSGYDLVTANAIKTLVVIALTAVAVPIFIAHGQVEWAPALLLSVGFAGGGIAGARFAVRGGDRLIRPVLALSVVALAGRMLGLY